MKAEPTKPRDRGLVPVRCPVCTGPIVHRRRKVSGFYPKDGEVRAKPEHVCEACDVIVVLHVISRRPSKRQRYLDELARLDVKRPPEHPPEHRGDIRNWEAAWAKVYKRPSPFLLPFVRRRSP